LIYFEYFVYSALSVHSFEDDIEVYPLNSIEAEQWDPPAPTKEAINKYLRKVVNKPDESN
jgi:hypothetical protein